MAKRRGPQRGRCTALRNVVVEPPASDDPTAWKDFFHVVADESRIRLELPKLLADLVEAGKPLRAADLVRQWGRGARSPRSIWKEIQEEVRPR